MSSYRRKSFRTCTRRQFVLMRLFSPDYNFEWNGKEWVPAQQPVFSPDGQHLWVGERWIPIPPISSGGILMQHPSHAEMRDEEEYSSNQNSVLEQQEHLEKESTSVNEGTEEDSIREEGHSEESSSLEIDDDDDAQNDEEYNDNIDEDQVIVEQSENNEHEIIENNNDAEMEEGINEIELAGWELAVVGQDIEGNRIDIFEEVRDCTVSDLLRLLAEYIENIPSIFSDPERKFFMVTLYLLPPREAFFPWVIEQNGIEIIENTYRCTIDEFWQKKVIDRTATGSLYLPNLHFIWYSDSEDISAEGHFGFDVIRQIDLDVNLKIPSISTIDIMQLVVWLVNGKYEKIKQQWHL